VRLFYHQCFRCLASVFGRLREESWFIVNVCDQLLFLFRVRDQLPVPSPSLLVFAKAPPRPRLSDRCRSRICTCASPVVAYFYARIQPVMFEATMLNNTSCLMMLKDFGADCQIAVQKTAKQSCKACVLGCILLQRRSMQGPVHDHACL